MSSCNDKSCGCGNYTPVRIYTTPQEYMDELYAVVNPGVPTPVRVAWAEWLKQHSFKGCPVPKPTQDELAQEFLQDYGWLPKYVKEYHAFYVLNQAGNGYGGTGLLGYWIFVKP